MTAPRPPAWIVVLDHTYLARTLTERGTACIGIAGSLSKVGALTVISNIPDHQQASFEAWLRDWEIPYSELYMRPVGDPRLFPDFCHDTYDRHLRWRSTVLGALDDSLVPPLHWLEIGIQPIHILAA